jgi:hypothetical protein
MFKSASSITNWGAPLVRLALQIALAAYSGDFSGFSGTMLYQNTTYDFEYPVIYAYELDNSLWIAIRGSAELYDFMTDAEFNETNTSLGTFHLGAYHAALHVLAQLRSFMSSYAGSIYITGHSYGGSVSAVLLVLAQSEFPRQDINGVGFASYPMMDDRTSARHAGKIATIVNGVDIVPTLSVPNLYVSLWLLIPLFEAVPEEEVIAFLDDILDVVSIFLPPKLYEVCRGVMPQAVDAVLGFAHGEDREIRYVPGHVYQLIDGEPRNLDDCEINPADKLWYLSLSVHSIEDHYGASYENVVNQLPDWWRNWFRFWFQ